MTARLYYNALHTHPARNSIGLLLKDGAPAGSFDAGARPGFVTVPVANLATSEWHTYEILLPYADSVEFRGLIVNEGAAFAAVPPRPVIRYVAYGDSITQGYWASVPTSNYPARVGDARGWQVQNMGFGGRQATASDGTAVGSLKGAVVTILMGVNDSIAGKTPAQFEADYTNLIRNIRAQQPETPIYAITPLYTTAPYGGGALIPQYRAVISNIVASAGDPNLRLVDGLSLGIDAGNWAALMPDGIHPNDAGFALVAANLGPRLSFQIVRPPRGLVFAVGQAGP